MEIDELYETNELNELNELNKSNEFKAGDLVYCPTISNSILRVDFYQEDVKYMFLIRDSNDDVKAAMTQHGKLYNSHHSPSVFHATPENKALLDALYAPQGLTFESPKIKLFGSALCKQLLKVQGHVFCFVSNESDIQATKNKLLRCVTEYKPNKEHPFVTLDNNNNYAFKYAVPVDPATLLPLDQEVEVVQTQETKPNSVIQLGNYKFPKPETEPLEDQESYYTPSILNKELYHKFTWYHEIPEHLALLRAGMVHKTQEAAEQHAKALLAVSQGKVIFY